MLLDWYTPEFNDLDGRLNTFGNLVYVGVKTDCNINLKLVALLLFLFSFHSGE